MTFPEPFGNAPKWDRASWIGGDIIHFLSKAHGALGFRILKNDIDHNSGIWITGAPVDPGEKGPHHVADMTELSALK